MALTLRLLRLALWCADQELRARRDGKPPGVQAWNSELVRALAHAVSSPRQETGNQLPDSNHDETAWIGSRLAAQMLGCDIRTVQRRAGDLDGRKVAGKLVFRESFVREYAEGLNQ
jgi:hypothetical protein